MFKGGFVMNINISVYDESTFTSLSEIIRLLARKTQTSLWGKKFICCSKADSILFLDSGDKAITLNALAKTINASYIEYILFREDGRPIYILSNICFDDSMDNFESSNEALLKRCSFLDAHLKSASFSIINSDFIRKSKGYSNIKRNVKEKIKNGFCSEYSSKRKYSDDFLKSTDVFITDEFNQKAILSLLSNGNSPAIIHIHGNEKDVYCPYEMCEHTCFIPDPLLFKEALYCVYSWLYDKELFSPALRFKNILDSSGSDISQNEIKNEISKPLRNRSKNNGKYN